jgi:hypothetical protein
MIFNPKLPYEKPAPFKAGLGICLILQFLLSGMVRTTDRPLVILTMEIPVYSLGTYT